MGSRAASKLYFGELLYIVIENPSSIHTAALPPQPQHTYTQA